MHEREGKTTKRKTWLKRSKRGKRTRRHSAGWPPSRWPEVGWASNRLTLTKPTKELCHPAPPHDCPIVMRLSEAPGVSACGPLIHCDMGKKAVWQQRYHRDGCHWRRATQEHAMGRTCADEIRNWRLRQTTCLTVEFPRGWAQDIRGVEEALHTS